MQSWFILRVLCRRLENGDKMGKENIKAPDSIIAAEMSIDGDVAFAGSIVINGRISGMVKGEKAKLGDSGIIDGDVVLKEFDCGGRVKGSVSAERLWMRKGSEIEGTIFAREFDMVPGAMFNGDMKVGQVPDAAPVSQTRGSVGSAAPADSSEKKRVIVPAGADHEKAVLDGEADASIVDGLAGALSGGSSVIMVVSRETESRRQVCDELRDRLKDRYAQVFIDEPTGSFGEMLLRVARGFGIDLTDYSDQEVMLGDLAASMSGSGRYLLVLDNVERMYPATLERMIRYLAADENGENEMTKLVLFGSPDLKKMLDFGDSSVFTREPDCVFEL